MTTLLVAATGGHLAQLYQLRPRLVPAGEPVLWVTFDSPQSRSMLADENVYFVPYVAPRNYARVLTNAVRAHRLYRRMAMIDRVISTGSGVALAFLPMARAHRIPTHYIESAARSEGPSLTGKLLSRVPGIQLSAQYDAWAGGRWTRSVSVFDDFTPAPAEPIEVLQRVVVTLGTIEGYGFRSLLERLIEILPPGADVLWQTGVTDVSGLAIEARASMPQHELHEAMAKADVVVAHSGIGSALGALNAGKCPVLVPRRAERGEHVDDHQAQIALELDGRGLAVHREAPLVTQADLLLAAGRTVLRQQPTLCR